MNKSCVYVAGVSNGIREEILKELDMCEGSFPFRYLRVSLHTCKLNSKDCKVMVYKITTKLQHWSTRMLSFTGRVHLVVSVISGMRNFWAQNFCIPKEVVKRVDSICRVFIWNGKDLGYKKALVSWDQMCLPRSCGGLNLSNMYIWNKAATLKHL